MSNDMGLVARGADTSPTKPNGKNTWRNPLPANTPEAGTRVEPSGEPLGFGDFIDIINPLQHIPIISTVYRAVTGDQISPGARLIGGTLLGGPIGFAVATANVATELATGKDIGEQAMAMAAGTDDTPNDEVDPTPPADDGLVLASYGSQDPGPSLDLSPVESVGPDTMAPSSVAGPAPAPDPIAPPIRQATVDPDWRPAPPPPAQRPPAQRP
ncbi:MAG: hypothetical protein AAGC83_14600, partial [Pseudomonadota bacterium]